MKLGFWGMVWLSMLVAFYAIGWPRYMISAHMVPDTGGLILWACVATFIGIVQAWEASTTRR